MDLDKSGLFSKMFDHVKAYTAFTRGEKDEPDRRGLNRPAELTCPSHWDSCLSSVTELMNE